MYIKKLLKFFYLIIILLIFLISLNLFLIKWAKPGKKGYQFTISDKELGFFHNPGLKFFDNKYKGYVRINNEGFRNEYEKENDYTFLTYSAGIFMFGDSMLDLFYKNEVLPNYELQRRYNEFYVNAACISYSNIQEFLLLKRLYYKYDFKKALFFIYDGNDPYNNYQINDFLPSIIKRNGKYTIIQPKKIKKQTFLWHFIVYSLFFAAKFNKIQKDINYWNKQMFMFTYSLKNDKKNMYQKNFFILKKIIDFSKKNGIDIKFYLIPNIVEIEKEYNKELINNWRKNHINTQNIKEFFKQIRNNFSTFIKENGEKCIDLTQYIKKYSDGNFYNKTNFHLTPKAYKVLINKGIIK